MKLDKIIFLNNNKEEKHTKEEIDESKKYDFDLSESVKDLLENNKLEYKEYDFVDINHPELIEFIRKCDIDYFIFSGGGILKSEVLSVGPKFIHLHPGIVPFYRGSTCFYYSIINEDKCGVTAFIMDENLDTGDIITQKTFPKPNYAHIDSVYDSQIRSETLIHVLKNKLLEKHEFQSQDPSKGTTYFIIHPVLKHIAILSCLP